MTIGKIHCAKLIHENYKYLKRKGTQPERVTKYTGFGYELVTSSSKCRVLSILVRECEEFLNSAI